MVFSRSFKTCTLAATLLVAVLAGTYQAHAVEANRYGVAVVIGNKSYGKGVPEVDFAHNDANAMHRFITDRLGYHPDNILDLRDATQAELIAAFGNEKSHKGKVWRWLRPGKSDVIVFYSGHGVPGLNDRRGYLLPVNADPDAPELNGYPVDQLYVNLAKLGARSVTVFLDACFSGDTPKGMVVRATSGILIEPRLPKGAKGLTVLTAASGKQVASWDEKAKHGLFTRHLLAALGGLADSKEFGDGDGKVTLAEVKLYLDEEMTYAARRTYGREQNATSIGDEAAVLSIVPEGAEPASVPAAPQVAALPPSTNESDAAKDTEPTRMTTGEKRVNVRSGPGTGHGKIAQLPAYAEVVSLGLVPNTKWQHVQLPEGGEGYVYAPLLTKVAPRSAMQPKLEVGTASAESAFSVVLPSGLTLGDWTLLARDRLKRKEYGELVKEASAHLSTHGDFKEVSNLLAEAALADVRARKGMERLQLAVSYRGRFGELPSLSGEINAITASLMKDLKVRNEETARSALGRAKRLAGLVGETPTLLKAQARAYHVLGVHAQAVKAYTSWLRQASPSAEDRKEMAEGLVLARAGRALKLGPGIGEVFKDCDVCPEMVVVPAGEFMMGSKPDEATRNRNEGPRHRVQILHPFAIGKFEVTFAEWDACKVFGGCGGYRPKDEGWGRGRQPVINVSWNDAKSYVAWLSRKTGQQYRLLSEAEWEYAARAGATTAFHTGDHISPVEANFDSNFSYNGSPKGAYKERSLATGQFGSNAFGLHDVHGNIGEWVEDCWNENYAGAQGDGKAIETGDCANRVLRGGSWFSPPSALRSASRDWNGPDYLNTFLGFRVARTLSR
jgi:formylglycine-generating enzyme required for sulfatase activity